MKKFLLSIFSLTMCTCHGGGNNPVQEIPFLLATVETLLVTINRYQDPEIIVSQERREKLARKKANSLKHKEILNKKQLKNGNRPIKICNGPDFKKPHR